LICGEARSDARNVPTSDPLGHGPLCGVGAANAVRAPGDRLPSVFATRVFSNAAHLLEPYTYAEARLHKNDVESRLTELMKKEYADCGLELHGIGVGSFVRHQEQNIRVAP
jgi:hypothetical protein